MFFWKLFTSKVNIYFNVVLPYFLYLLCFHLFVPAALSAISSFSRFDFVVSCFALFTQLEDGFLEDGVRA